MGCSLGAQRQAKKEAKEEKAFLEKADKTSEKSDDNAAASPEQEAGGAIPAESEKENLETDKNETEEKPIAASDVVVEVKEKIENEMEEAAKEAIAELDKSVSGETVEAKDKLGELQRREVSQGDPQIIVTAPSFPESKYQDEDWTIATREAFTEEVSSEPVVESSPEVEQKVDFQAEDWSTADSEKPDSKVPEPCADDIPEAPVIEDVKLADENWAQPESEKAAAAIEDEDWATPEPSAEPQETNPSQVVEEQNVSPVVTNYDDEDWSTGDTEKLETKYEDEDWSETPVEQKQTSETFTSVTDETVLSASSQESKLEDEDWATAESQKTEAKIEDEDWATGEGNVTEAEAVSEEKSETVVTDMPQKTDIEDEDWAESKSKKVEANIDDEDWSNVAEGVGHEGSGEELCPAAAETAESDKHWDEDWQTGPPPPVNAQYDDEDWTEGNDQSDVPKELASLSDIVTSSPPPLPKAAYEDEDWAVGDNEQAQSNMEDEDWAAESVQKVDEEVPPPIDEELKEETQHVDEDWAVGEGVTFGENIEDEDWCTAKLGELTEVTPQPKTENISPEPVNLAKYEEEDWATAESDKVQQNIEEEDWSVGDVQKTESQSPTETADIQADVNESQHMDEDWSTPENVAEKLEDEDWAVQGDKAAVQSKLPESLPPPPQAVDYEQEDWATGDSDKTKIEDEDWSESDSKGVTSKPEEDFVSDGQVVEETKHIDEDWSTEQSENLTDDSKASVGEVTAEQCVEEGTSV